MRRNTLEDINTKALASSYTDPVTGCYVYTKYTDKDGYPPVKYNGQTKRMVRMLWLYFYGTPVPPDKVVMHICDNPSCVNIEHLKLGSYYDNSRDRDVKNRRGYRPKTISLARMFELLKTNTQRDVSKLMGFSESYISMLVKKHK